MEWDNGLVTAGGVGNRGKVQSGEVRSSDMEQGERTQGTLRLNEI